MVLGRFGRIRNANPHDAARDTLGKFKGAIGQAKPCLTSLLSRSRPLE